MGSDLFKYETKSDCGRRSPESSIIGILANMSKDQNSKNQNDASNNHSDEDSLSS